MFSQSIETTTRRAEAWQLLGRPLVARTIEQLSAAVVKRRGEQFSDDVASEVRLALFRRLMGAEGTEERSVRVNRKKNDRRFVYKWLMTLAEPDSRSQKQVKRAKQFVLRIAGNLAREEVRKRLRLGKLELRESLDWVESSGADPHKGVIGVKALRQLTGTELVTFIYFAGHSLDDKNVNADVAKELRIPEATFRKRWERTSRRLRDAIGMENKDAIALISGNASSESDGPGSKLKEPNALQGKSWILNACASEPDWEVVKKLMLASPVSVFAPSQTIDPEAATAFVTKLYEVLGDEPPPVRPMSELIRAALEKCAAEGSTPKVREWAAAFRASSALVT